MHLTEKLWKGFYVNRRGCGAFGQDAYIRDRCFAKVINQHNYFDGIIFAVKEVNRCMDSGNSHKLHSDFYGI